MNNIRIGIRTFAFPFFLWMVLLLQSSCAKENHGPVYPPATFSYKVESVTYDGGLAYCTFDDSLMTMQAELYSNPVTENYLFMNYSGAYYLAPGVYPIGYDSVSHATVSLIYYRDGSHPYTSTTGSLTITSFDTVSKIISGQFQFTGKYLSDVRHITLGTFDNLHYWRQ